MRWAKEHTHPDTLRELLDYDPETGRLHWKRRDDKWFTTARDCARWNTQFAGKEAFTSINKGYRSGAVLGKKVQAHRAAFSIHYGRIPTGQIDHINGVRADNRIENLREVDARGNARNQSLRADSTTGFVGIHKQPDGLFLAHITDAGRHYQIGRFDTLRDAIIARKFCERILGFHQNHGRNPA